MKLVDPSLDILTPNEVASALRLSRVYIYKLMREGKLPYLRIGKVIRLSREEVERWLEERRNLPWRRTRGR